MQVAPRSDVQGDVLTKPAYFTVTEVVRILGATPLRLLFTGLMTHLMIFDTENGEEIKVDESCSARGDI